jgi:hypothetical protein
VRTSIKLLVAVAESFTTFGCVRGQNFRVSYSYVSGGVTQQSNITAVPCRTGPQE